MLQKVIKDTNWKVRPRGVKNLYNMPYINYENVYTLWNIPYIRYVVIVFLKYLLSWYKLCWNVSQDLFLTDKAQNDENVNTFIKYHLQKYLVAILH